ncbi:TBC1 domain family member 25-like isoform X1 [Branchiostoma floridae x Branchiostoma japonicum]
MEGIVFPEEREVIRIKVKKCEGLMQPEYRKFAVDPQITSYEVLRHTLRRAFHLQSDFTISYLSHDSEGQEVWLSLLSDWDLDAAFISSSHPYLRLRVDARPFEDGPMPNNMKVKLKRRFSLMPKSKPSIVEFTGHKALDDWDIISSKDTPEPVPHPVVPNVPNNRQKPPTQPFRRSLFSSVQTTLTKMTQVLSFNDTKEEEDEKPMKPALSDTEFHSFLDESGRLIRPEDLRLRIYHGGVDPALRKVVWRHLLNVYPAGMGGKERMDYMKRKANEYLKLKAKFLAQDTEEAQFVKNMVKKDVLRTDRTLDFFAVPDEHPNITALSNILTTFALTHPDVSYCQGMSDFASPLLVTMRDEAQAYVCFCALMNRIKPNFMLDGEAMTHKFQHLTELMHCVAPEFTEYLYKQQAEDLFFCYRWMLLELKREFAYYDALRMLEVMWSSLPPSPPQKDLELIDNVALMANLSIARYPYNEADRRQKGRRSSSSSNQSNSPKSREHRMPNRRGRRRASSNSDKEDGNHNSMVDGRGSRMPSKDVESKSTNRTTQQITHGSSSSAHSNGKSSLVPNGPKAAIPNGELPSPARSPMVFKKQLNGLSMSSLPPPDKFGYGNPFMLFLCLTILLQHQDIIMREQMDYNDIAMHFDKHVRKHNVNKVLNKARTLFAEYLKAQLQKSASSNGSGPNQC